MYERAATKWQEPVWGQLLFRQRIPLLNELIIESSPRRSEPLNSAFGRLQIAAKAELI